MDNDLSPEFRRRSGQTEFSKSLKVFKDFKLLTIVKVHPF